MTRDTEYLLPTDNKHTSEISKYNFLHLLLCFVAENTITRFIILKLLKPKFFKRFYIIVLLVKLS